MYTNLSAKKLLVFVLEFHHEAAELNPIILDDTPGNTGTSKGITGCRGT